MIKLRPATIKDLELLKFWDKQQHVIDCDPDEDWDWEKELARKPAWREQLVAELNDDPIGFVQIIDPYKRAIDIWIGEERNLNKGYGTAIMKLAIELCFSQTEVDGILIDPLKSNTKAHKFYEKIGFEFVEERVFNDTVCYVYELKPR